MSISAESAPIDRKCFDKVEGHAEQENVLTLGAGSYIGEVEIKTFAENQNSPHILVGRFCSLADKIYFAIGGEHNYKRVSTFPFDVNRLVQKIFVSTNPLPYERPNHYQVIIGHDAWIGRNVTIKGGVKIGNGAVIGANSIVAKDIPPYAIAVGNPARVIKYRFDEETIRKFLAVKWWNWSLEKIADNFPLMNDVEKFLDTHYSPALEELFKDEFTQKLNNFAGGGRRFINSLPTSRRKLRCGLKLSKAFVNRILKTHCLSFGSTKIPQKKILICSAKRRTLLTTAQAKIFWRSNPTKIFRPPR